MSVLPVVSEETKLLDLISPRSFKFFTILDTDNKWLEIDSGLWDSDKNFQSARDFVKTVKFTNDVAVRGVKDYCKILIRDDSEIGNPSGQQAQPSSRKLHNPFSKVS